MKKIKVFKKIMKILSEIDLNTLKPKISLSDIIKMDSNKKEYLDGLDGQRCILFIFFGIFSIPMLVWSICELFGFSSMHSFLITFSSVLLFYFLPIIFIWFENLFLFNKLLDKKVREYNELEMYKEILDKIDDNTLIDNIDNIIKVAFLNNIGFEIQEYIDNRIDNELYSDMLFKNKYLLEIYLKSLNDEEKIDFYNKEVCKKLNKYLSDVDLLNLEKSYILSAVENYVTNNGENKDRAVYNILKELNGDICYTNVLKKRLGMVNEKNGKNYDKNRVEIKSF